MEPSTSLLETSQSLIEHTWESLSPLRRDHVLGVTHTMVTLAAIHGLDVEAAAVAALLHDRSKEVGRERMRAELENWGEPIAAEDLDFPGLWHALHAAAWARHELGIHNPDILEAVRLHPTADEGVGPLTRLMFVADYCEPTRRRETAARVRAAARRDLDEAFRMALAAKSRHVRRKKRLCPRAARALRAYLTEDFDKEETSWREN